MNLISQAITLSGGVVSLAKHCGVTYQAVRRWERHNRLPRTDLTGETEYARAIAKATKNMIGSYALLKITRDSWAKNTVRTGFNRTGFKKSRRAA